MVYGLEDSRDGGGGAIDDHSIERALLCRRVHNFGLTRKRHHQGWAGEDNAASHYLAFRLVEMTALCRIKSVVVHLQSKLSKKRMDYMIKWQYLGVGREKNRKRSPAPCCRQM